MNISRMYESCLKIGGSHFALLFSDKALVNARGKQTKFPVRRDPRESCRAEEKQDQRPDVYFVSVVDVFSIRFSMSKHTVLD
jgi:hypothetical protein